LVHKDIFNPEETKKYQQEVASGTNKSEIHIDKYGNTIWGIHSGTEKGKANPADRLREKIQGGNIKNPDSYLREAKVSSNVSDLIGDIVPIEQDDGTTRLFKIVASGIIPHGELNDKFYNDAKDATNTIIEATGGINSSFNKLKERPGIILHTCLHGVSQTPNDPNKITIDQRYETLVVGLAPTDASILENEVEIAPSKRGAESKISKLEKSARILSQTINSASSRVQDSGDAFKKIYY